MQNELCALDLSVVIPAFNEAINLAGTLEDIAAYLSQKSYQYEVIVIDDGSTDNTRALAAGFRSRFNKFILLKNDVNKGKGNALKKGMLAAQGEFILFMDADNATRIGELDKLLEALKQNHDLAIASRRMPGAIIEVPQPWYRRVMGFMYVTLTGLILHTHIRDYNCGFKLFTRAVAHELFSKVTRDDWSFDSEIIYLAARAGYKLVEVPVRWHDKKETSKVKPLRDALRSFWSLVKIRGAHR